MSNHHINRRNYSTNVRTLDFKRKAVETLITMLWHLAPVFTLHKVTDLFFGPTRPRLSTDQSRMIAQGRRLRATVHDKTIRVSQRPHSTIRVGRRPKHNSLV